MNNIDDRITTQAWDGVEVVPDLPGRGRGVKVTRTFAVNEVVCDYGGRLLTHKEGKDKYEQQARRTPWATCSRSATREPPSGGTPPRKSRAQAALSTTADAIQM